MIMPTMINVDPGISSKIKEGMARLHVQNHALATQIEAQMQSAHAQAVQVAKTGIMPFGPAVPHSVVLAHSAFTDDSDAVISSLESGVVIGTGSDGVIWGTGQWEQLDPGWIGAFADFIWSLITGKQQFSKTPQTVKIPNQVKIAMAGDWGTGEWRDPANPAPSTGVRNQMASLNPDVTIHLGDVYYGGEGEEEQDRLVQLWPPAPSGSFALNSNHEMYSGAGPYFKAISNPPFDKQGGCSYFALENDNWVIVGLDSAYNSHEEELYANGLLFQDNHPNELNEFLLEKGVLANNNNPRKKVIVLTHHNGLDDPGLSTNTLFSQVMNAFPNNSGPAYWYWGHQHLAVVYKPQGAAGVSCRCCGHGALPCGKASVLENSPNVVWHEDRLANDPDIPERVLNGFAMLTLDGPNIREVFYDEKGGVAWASS
jgi:hypothetical protein